MFLTLFVLSILSDENMEDLDSKEPKEHRRHRRRHSTHLFSQPAQPDVRPWYYIAAFCVALLLLLTTETDTLPEWRVGFNYSGMLVLLFLVFLSVETSEKPLKLLLQPFNLFQLLLVGWTIAESVMSPLRPFAIMESARIISGAAAFFFGAYALRTKTGAIILACCISSVVLIFSVVDFMHISDAGGTLTKLESGFFGTHETMGTLVMLVLSISAAIGAHIRVREQWRWGGLAVFLILLVVLIVTKCRSAWLGGAVGVVVSAMMLLFCRPTTGERGFVAGKGYRTLLLGGLFVPLIVFIALGVTGNLSAVVSRFNTLSQGNKIRDVDPARPLKWDAAALMLHERPIMGFGPGSYLVLQSHWTHQGNDSIEVLNGDLRHENIAHNYYIQWGADTGGVGVFLHIAAVLSCATVLFVGIPRMGKDPLRQAIALGSLGTLIAGAVDGFTSPSYNFPGLYALYWGIIGMGVGAFLSLSIPEKETRSRSRSKSSVEPFVSTQISPAWFVLGILLSGISLFFLLNWGKHLADKGNSHPRGHLVMTKHPRLEGQTVVGFVWDVVYRDASGTANPTWPGTIWSVASPNKSVEPKFTQGGRLQGDVSVSNIEIPGEIPPLLTIKAAYRDPEGRLYEVTSSTLAPVNGKPITPLGDNSTNSVTPTKPTGKNFNPSIFSLPR